MDDLEVYAIISRILVVESAQAAGMLVAAPVGSGGGDVLLVVSREPRDEGTFACVFVRIYLPGVETPEQRAPVSPPGRAEWLALVDSGATPSDDDEQVYLVPGAAALREENWRNSGFQATPARWASLFSETPESISD